MQSFEDFKINKQLRYAIEDLGFSEPTPIQQEAFGVIRSGRDVVGIAQTGTGKTFAYMLPVLEGLKFSKQINPRVLILVPTRELVLQVVDQIKEYGKYSTIRVLGVYGGTNINTQRQEVAQGCDILVGTPGRLYDLAVSRTLQLKSIKQLIIDEVDVMLDLGFRFQLVNIFDLLPPRRQNIMFSATMTDEVDELMDTFFTAPERIQVALSGTPLDAIEQHYYELPNFYTKANLLIKILKDKDTFKKALIFVSNKKHADRLFQTLEEVYGDAVGVIHANKTQNYRINAIEQFDAGTYRILVTTDVMARGLDLDQITHVFNTDVPRFPENYMHRIGRTGRAGTTGSSYLLGSPAETDRKEAIEELMEMKIPQYEVPEELEISKRLLPEEEPDYVEINNPTKRNEERGASFHEKKEKNRKVNLGGKYKREIAKKYKKPKTRGDKSFNRRYKK
ncbi:DEAD/DEAH box helicase [Leeuwenhoekiella marinoflava]|uniref:ATP-dependent RNA helicase RhlE n=2 Tax=Leeuwenhoekiella marinoflava TaxID=988 RepID=A0A4V1KSL3_9FLAO|nr:DEAD/DEAH box helicase [Leeuwenhoekiella marinoflava]RXG32138.1 ATP-dependent RNA helicase RhlE [Leeuwenhoekiella marinoflava]SHE85870.1 ATP-dependent RNA helicase RhlE [Leeuwenhoekiella marinoflava DSM 3653]